MASHINRAEHRVRATRNKILKKLFVCNRDEATGAYRIIGNEQRHNLLFSSYVKAIQFGMCGICSNDRGEKDIPEYEFEYMKRQLRDLNIDGCLTYR
jgi:hypothetical protein